MPERIGKREKAYDKVIYISEGSKGKLTVKELELAIDFFSKDMAFGVNDVKEFDRELRKAVNTSIKRGGSRKLINTLDNVWGDLY